jgi:hypothetical protein
MMFVCSVAELPFAVQLLSLSKGILRQPEAEYLLFSAFLGVSVPLWLYCPQEYRKNPHENDRHGIATFTITESGHTYLFISLPPPLPWAADVLFPPEPPERGVYVLPAPGGWLYTLFSGNGLAL